MARNITFIPTCETTTFADAVEKARAEYLTLAVSRLNKLAVGGIVPLPAYDKEGNPIRKHASDCAPGQYDVSDPF